MKTIHTLLLVMFICHVQAQPDPTPSAHETAVAFRTPDFQPERSADAHYNPVEKQEQAGWYISTDPTNRLTSILFLDTSQRIIYEEKLPGQFVELTKFNRRILDQMLSQLTSHQMVSNKLKTKPIPELSTKDTPLLPDNLPENLPAETAMTGPMGIQYKVSVINSKILRVWWKNPTAEKVTFWVRSPDGKTLYLNTCKTSQYSDILPMVHLPEGTYKLELYTKTWQKKYELHISRDQKKVMTQLLQQK